MNLVDTPEMEAFFQRLDLLDQAQVLAMAAAWNSTSREVHEDAWATVRGVGAREGLVGEIDRVRKKALDWTSSGSSSIPYVINAWQSIKLEGAEAAVDAALAVALGSRLDPDTHRILISPWLRATEA